MKYLSAFIDITFSKNCLWVFLWFRKKQNDYDVKNKDVGYKVDTDGLADKTFKKKGDSAVWMVVH